MIASMMDAVYDLLSSDTTIQTYLGASGSVRIGWVNENAIFPCITIWETNEGSTTRPSYDSGKRRDNVVTFQIDTWVDVNHEGFPCTSRDLNEIADYIDWLVFNARTQAVNADTRTAFRKVRELTRTASVEQQERTTSNTLFHKTRTFSFVYSVQD